MQPGFAPVVGIDIKANPGPFQTAQNAGAHTNSVLANAAGKSDCIDPFHCGNQRSRMAQAPIAKVLNCKGAVGRGIQHQVAHVRFTARQAQKAAFMIQDSLCAFQPIVGDQTQDRIGIDAARARAHCQPV